jgi:hypothetical protein
MRVQTVSPTDEVELLTPATEYERRNLGQTEG